MPSSKEYTSTKKHVERNEEDIAAAQLQEITGYTQQLVKNRSTFHVVFMAFVLAAIPYGLATSLFYPLINGGPVTIIWGWITVSTIIICVAVSLAEITSVYPTAGGVYYQTFMLLPPSSRKLGSWICGAAYAAGNILITLAVNFGTTGFFIGCINVFEVEPGVGIFQAATYQHFLIFVAITVLCNATSAYGNRWLPLLDTFAIFWTFAGLAAIVVCLLAIARNGRNSAEYIFGGFEPMSGWPSGWAFCVGLLHAAYSTSSTGMVISMCEEVKNPRTQVPKAIIFTVLINTLAGLLFLIPVVAVLPSASLSTLLQSDQPFPVIVKSAIGSEAGSFLLLLPLIILALLNGIACTTATSRCIWAFARDGAIPGARHWSLVHGYLNVPLNAMMLSMLSQILLGSIYFGSEAAFNAFSSAGVIFLTVSYASPVAVSLMGKRKAVKMGGFDLGVFGVGCNVVALCWSALAVPLFCMPSYLPATAETVNYSCVVFVGFITVASLWYWLWGYKGFKGPVFDDVQALEN
ncbi:amino acid/polyamine transporter I [Aspergillus stella-maris]|uniref:amino acid/polyamine transporter I n=1 Tax=Aspergillus stella-maris TaxID=1810926 RepID=UPI003CCD6603